jgi:hypothetical protein
VVFPKFPSSLPASRNPSLYSPGAGRDPVLIQIETHLQQATRDAVNQGSRKPFFWGGLHGYEQLQVLAEELDQVQDHNPESDYLRLLRSRVEKVLALNRTVAADLKQAHQFLQRIAQGFHYPPLPPEGSALPNREKLSNQQIAQEIDTLIEATHPRGKIQRAQIRLLSALKRRWKLYAPELLYSYDIPGLPQDNLQLESFFGRLRRHQRRISGRNQLANCWTSDKLRCSSRQPMLKNYSVRSSVFPERITGFIEIVWLPRKSPGNFDRACIGILARRSGP